MHLCVNDKNAKQIVRRVTKKYGEKSIFNNNSNVCVLRKRSSLVINQSTFTVNKIFFKTIRAVEYYWPTRLSVFFNITVSKFV